MLKCAWRAEGSAVEHRLPDEPTIAELMTPAPRVAYPEITVESVADRSQACVHDVTSARLPTFGGKW